MTPFIVLIVLLCNLGASRCVGPHDEPISLKNITDAEQVVPEGCPTSFATRIFTKEPIVEVRWLKNNGTEDLPDGHFAYEHFTYYDHIYQLYLNKLTLSDSGTYEFRVATASQEVSFNTSLEVVPKLPNVTCLEPNNAHGDSAWFHRPPEVKPIPYYKSMLLHCLPKSILAWDQLFWELPDGTQLNRSQSTKSATVFNNGSIKVDTLHPNFQGMYRCISGPNLNSSSDVYIPMPAKISRLPNKFVSHVGCSIRINCLATGDAPLHISVRIPVGAKYGRLSVSGAPYTRDLIYELNRLTAKESGIYECIAENPYGPKSRTYIEINVFMIHDVTCPDGEVSVQDAVEYERPYQMVETKEQTTEAINRAQTVSLIAFQILPLALTFMITS